MAIRELGHIVLYVRDIERSVRFYRDVLQWKEVGPAPFPGAAIFSSGRTHHELLLIEVGPKASPIPRGPRIGLYHFGLKVGESDEELRKVVEQLQQHGVEIAGATDHGITHSVYTQDPDGNEIELYIDVQPQRWKDDPTSIFAAPKPLRL